MMTSLNCQSDFGALQKRCENVPMFQPQDHLPTSSGKMDWTTVPVLWAVNRMTLPSAGYGLAAGSTGVFHQDWILYRLVTRDFDF